jgi:hypothetical protein
MKILKSLSVAILLTGTMVSSTVSANGNTVVNYSDLPAKTIIIKHPAADNTTNYFSAATVIVFEVYKGGSPSDLDKITKAFKGESVVESFEAGPANGDYQAFSISLKTAKDKAWFAATFKKAGLNNIRINNNPVVAVDQM